MGSLAVQIPSDAVLIFKEVEGGLVENDTSKLLWGFPYGLITLPYMIVVTGALCNSTTIGTSSICYLVHLNLLEGVLISKYVGTTINTSTIYSMSK